jgi:hypothetical protein
MRPTLLLAGHVSRFSSLDNSSKVLRFAASFVSFKLSITLQV